MPSKNTKESKKHWLKWLVAGALLVAALTLLTILLMPKKKPLLGSDKCTYGPSYWCANEAQFKECMSPGGDVFSEVCQKYR